MTTPVILISFVAKFSVVCQAIFCSIRSQSGPTSQRWPILLRIAPILSTEADRNLYVCGGHALSRPVRWLLRRTPSPQKIDLLGHYISGKHDKQLLQPLGQDNPDTASEFVLKTAQRILGLHVHGLQQRALGKSFNLIHHLRILSLLLSVLRALQAILDVHIYGVSD